VLSFLSHNINNHTINKEHKELTHSTAPSSLFEGKRKERRSELALSEVEGVTLSEPYPLGGKPKG